MACRMSEERDLGPNTIRHRPGVGGDSSHAPGVAHLAQGQVAQHQDSWPASETRERLLRCAARGKRLGQVLRQWEQQNHPHQDPKKA